jgi:iron complex outermembrane receptor protein
MGSTPAWASDAGATATGAQVDELVVTAQKREQSLQSVAAAVTAMGAEALQRQGVADVTTLQFHVPSLVAGKLTGITAISIRGVGLNQFGYASQPGVAVHIDGVYQARLASGGLGQLDLARIEVLRGPQGTLYGRNATGGAVNFISAAPTDKFEGSVLAGYGSFSTYHLNAVVNAPLNEKVRTRLAVDYDDRGEGFEKNVRPSGSDADKGSVLSARFKVDADLSDNAKVELAAYGLQRRGGFPYLQLNSPPNAEAIAGNPFLAAAIVPLAPHRYSSELTPRSKLDIYGATATVDLDLGPAKLKSITAYSLYHYVDLYDSDGTNIPFTPQTDIDKAYTASQEFDLTGMAGRLNWLVGAFYMDDSLKIVTQYDFIAGFPANRLVPGSRLQLANRPYRVRSAAVFTDDTFNLTDRLRLIFGARYSEDKITSRELTTINGFQAAPGLVLPAVITCNNVETDPSFSSFTPRGGAQFDIAKDVGSYVTISRGFKDGGVNASSCNNIYQPEKITSYEGGLRMRFADRTITINPTLFYYDYTGFQVTQIQGLSSPVINAPKATVKGFELEAVWQANEHLTFNASLSLLDAEYGKGFTNTDTLNKALGVQNLAGHRLNRAPKESGSLGAEYRTSMMSFGRLSFRADIYASSRIYFREFNTALDSQPSYHVINLNLVWDSPDGKLTGRLYADNAGDENYLAQLGAADAFGARFSTWAPPRQIGAEIKARF